MENARVELTKAKIYNILYICFAATLIGSLYIAYD